MKKTLSALFLILLLTFGCNSDKELTAEELKIKLQQIVAEIEQIIGKSTGKSSADCRWVMVSSPTIYSYGILGIDTLKLQRLFEELRKTQSDLYLFEGGSIPRPMFGYSSSK
jgi:hypothetical protein